MRRVIISESSLQELKKDATLLPEFLAVNAMSHETSLGDNGALPDFGDRTCEYILLKKRYSDIMDMLEQFGYAEMSDDEKQNTLNSLVAECKELEKPVRPFLEKLCFNAVNRLFSIPKEAVIIQTNLVDMVKPSGAIVTPEGDDDYPSYTFDDISDMKFSHNAVLKRRFVNALIQGAAYTYSNMHDVYWEELVKVNKDFPYYYNRINVLNDYLTFATKEKISDDQPMQGSYVNVTVGDGDQKPVIESQAIIFPLLLRETIRGLFEMFSMHGLPKDKEKAEYIVKKADFILAEPWDIRLGIPMWERISERFEHTTLVPYIFMNMVSMENDEFNDSMQNILARTNKGEEILNGLVDNSIEDMRYADFKEKMKDYDTDSILLQDSYFSADDLGTLELDADDDNVIEEDDVNENEQDEVKSSEVDLSSFSKKNALEPKIWDNSNHLNSNIRNRLIGIAYDFWDFLNIDWVEPDGIVLVGSICNFNWSEYSDIDLHIIADFSEIDDNTELVGQYVNSKKNEWNELHDNLKIMGYDVELYVQDINDEVNSNGIYDLEGDEWIKEPNPDEVEDIDQESPSIRDKAADIMTIIDGMYDALSNGKVDVEKIGEDAENLWDDVKRMRRNSLGNEGEMGDGNICYKTLRRFGYLDRLFKLLTIVYDKRNSIG